MGLFNQSFTATRAALIYVTVGALIVIWTGVWYVYLYNNPPDPRESHSVYYWCTGFLVTGLAMVLIGLVLGRLGRSAGVADLAQGRVFSPPMTPASPLVVVNPPPNMAAQTPGVVPANPVPVLVGQDGQVVVPMS